MKIAKYLGYVVVVIAITVTILEWRTKPDTRVMTEAIYECGFSFSELSSNAGLFASYAIGMYWSELREAEYQKDHLSSIVNMLYSIHDVYGSKCDKIILSKLDRVKQMGFDFSVHRTESGKPLILGAVILQNKGMVDWLLNNGGYTDFRIDRVKSKYHNMNMLQLAKALDQKHSNQISKHIFDIVAKAHNELLGNVESTNNKI